MAQRTHRLQLRCSEAELAEIDIFAREYQLTRSAYVRQAALRVLDDDPMIVVHKADLALAPPAPRPRFGRIRRLFRRAGRPRAA